MGNRKQSIYSQEFRDEMARECHELLLERKTTVSLLRKGTSHASVFATG